MKKSCFLICVLSLLMFSQSVFAQATPEGVDSFKQDKNAWRRKEVEVKESGEITQKIKAKTRKLYSEIPRVLL